MNAKEKGIHSIWACYVFSQVLNVTSSRILSRILVGNIHRTKCYYGWSVFGEYIMSWFFEHQLSFWFTRASQDYFSLRKIYILLTFAFLFAFLNKTPKRRGPRYVNLTTCTTLKKARKESGPPGFCEDVISEMIRVRMLWVPWMT